MHRAPAWLELLALAAGSVVLFVLSSWPVVLGGLALVLLLGLGLARLPVAVLLGQARAVVWFLAAVLVVHVLVDGWRTGLDDGGLAVVRLLVLVLAAAVVTATCRVAEMVAVVETVCARCGCSASGRPGSGCSWRWRCGSCRCWANGRRGSGRRRRRAAGPPGAPGAGPHRGAAAGAAAGAGAHPGRGAGRPRRRRPGRTGQAAPSPSSSSQRARNSFSSAVIRRGRSSAKSKGTSTVLPVTARTPWSNSS